MNEGTEKTNVLENKVGGVEVSGNNEESISDVVADANEQMEIALKSAQKEISGVENGKEGLSSEEINKRIEKEERVYKKAIDFRTTKYEKSHKEPLDKRLFDLSIKEENEHHKAKIEFLNKIPKID